MHENMQVNTVNLHRILNFTIIVVFCCTSGMFYCNHRNASSCMAIFNHAPQVQGTAKTPQPHPSGARDCMFPPHLQSPTYRCTYQYVVRFDVGVQHPGSLHQLERQQQLLSVRPDSLDVQPNILPIALQHLSSIHAGNRMPSSNVSQPHQQFLILRSSMVHVQQFLIRAHLTSRTQRQGRDGSCERSACTAVRSETCHLDLPHSVFEECVTPVDLFYAYRAETELSHTHMYTCTPTQYIVEVNKKFVLFSFYDCSMV